MLYAAYTHGNSAYKFERREDFLRWIIDKYTRKNRLTGEKYITPFGMSAIIDTDDDNLADSLNVRCGTDFEYDSKVSLERWIELFDNDEFRSNELISDIVDLLKSQK